MNINIFKLRKFAIHDFTKKVCSKYFGDLCNLVVFGIVGVHSSAGGPGEKSLVVRGVNPL